MNQGWLYTNHIRHRDIGTTVLNFYHSHFPHSTRQDWLERVRSEQILLDGKPTTAETHLVQNQVLTYQRCPWIEPVVPLNFKQLYEDPHVWVIDKPSGLPVLPGGQFLEHTLLGQLKALYPQETPLPIHRLGRGTSGLVILARSRAARADLSQQMRDRTIQKHYLALVGSGPLPDQFTIEHPIGKFPYPKLGFIYAATSNGKKARSDCRVLQRRAESTLLSVKILTGRPHQIRIHLAAYGYPLLGDPLYTIGGIPKAVPQSGDERSAIPSDCGYWLHAHRLAFQHPISAIPLSFMADPPSLLTPFTTHIG